ncbi:MAG: DapH/DapD/GlmU-related protein, partial [Fidelibacterota bacterium]
KIPLLVEKPLALSRDEARKLNELAIRNKVPLMVGHVLLFHPAIEKMKTLIDSGKIGKLQYIYSNRLNLGTVRKEENILWSFAPHDISIFQYFIHEKPIEIVSRGGAFLQPDIQDTTLTIFRYPGNIIGHIFVSWLHPFKEHRLVLVGSKGMLTFEDSLKGKPLLFYEKGIDWVQGEPVKRDGPTETISYDSEFPLTRELKYFMQHLDGQYPVIANGNNGVEVLEILEQASKGLRIVEPRTKDLPKPFFVHPSSIIDKNVSIGRNTKIWHFSHIQSGAVVGENCSLGQNVNVGNNVKIGNQVKIQNNVSIYEGVELEDYVFCGPSMVFTNVTRPRSEFPQRGTEFYARTLVKKSVTIGANATIVCGITIGEYAFIGAGAVVTKDVPAHALVIGNPGRIAGWVDDQGHKIEFDNRGISRCGRYSLIKGKFASIV